MAPGPLGYAYGTTSKQQSSSDYLSFFSLSLLQSASCLLAFVSCTWLCSWATLRACARRSASSLWDDVMSIFPLSESFLWRLHRCVTMTASNANIAFRTQAVVFEKKVINKPDILLMFRGHKGVQREWTTKLSEELTKPGTRSLLYRRQYWKLYGSRLALVRSWFPSQGFEVSFQGVQRSIPIAANLLVAFCALSKLLAWSFSTFTCHARFRFQKKSYGPPWITSSLHWTWRENEKRPSKYCHTNTHQKLPFVYVDKHCCNIEGFERDVKTRYHLLGERVTKKVGNHCI